jgi:hypothetical protein
MNVHVTIETVEDLSLDRFVVCILDTLSLDIQEVTQSCTNPVRKSDVFRAHWSGHFMAEKLSVPWPDWEPPRVIQRLSIAA